MHARIWRRSSIARGRNTRRFTWPDADAGVAAVIDADDLDALLELAEDMIDIREAAAARAEMTATGAEPIPWERVKADLGLT